MEELKLGWPQAGALGWLSHEEGWGTELRYKSVLSTPFPAVLGTGANG